LIQSGVRHVSSEPSAPGRDAPNTNIAAAALEVVKKFLMLENVIPKSDVLVIAYMEEIDSIYISSRELWACRQEMTTRPAADT
jgi:hypothetical protein